MQQRKIYFGAGPAALPEEVLRQAAEAVISYKDTGLSILELPHRGKHFNDILDESRSLVRELCRLGDDYDILWLQGGGRHQFVMVPMNFLTEGKTAGYIDSGHWAHEAIDAGRYFGNVDVLTSSADDHYAHLPKLPKKVSPDLAYVHFTTNNTIYGTQWSGIPDCPAPLIADMSSDIFSTKRDYDKCALFYAVAQKNIGPSGVTLVVIRRDMLQRIGHNLPDALSYAGQVHAGSLLNTPPVFAIYTSLLMLRWIADKSITAIEAENRQKAAALYAEIQRNSLFYAPVAKDSRSIMNVVFRGKDEAAERAFLPFAEERNIEGIAGHRSVGGFRASLYNAVTPEHVQYLIGAMQEFETTYEPQTV
jgi:phosphoserine aminotransferase